jgi:hypothetical protein
MIKLESVQLENIDGGVSCSYVMGVIFGFGAGTMFVPTPLNIAVGVVSMAVGAGGAYFCSN